MKKLLARSAKTLFRMAGLDVRNRRTVYVDHLEDLARSLGGVAEPVILDIGSNRGDTVAAYRGVFPKAEIHAFEPTPEMCAALTERFRSDQRVKVVPKAVSDQIGTTTFHLASTSVLNSMLPYRDTNTQYYGETQVKRIEVPTVTISGYCEENHIDTVHIAKLDIQGSEKLALAGARSMLAEGKIESIYLEIAFFPLYEGQSTFADSEAILRACGYRLYGFYELVRESNGCLDYCNALYVSPGLYERLEKHYLFCL